MVSVATQATLNAASSEVTPNVDAVWSRAQEWLKQKMSQPSFETWISPLKIQACQPQANGMLETILEAESEFNRDFILKHYRSQLKDALTQAIGQPCEIKIEVNASEGESQKAENAENTVEEPAWRPWSPRSTKSNLNPRYTFENIVVGQHNRFPHAAALAVAETPAQSYNPFFIYGGVGLGKTHLMQAIGHFVLTHAPDLRVRYVTAEQFTNDLIQAISSREMKGFRDKYRRNDILILDDIQFLEGKERTQEEVFHTFNELHSAGKQVILSSDRPPKHLSRLESRLKSRFEWGLIADIQTPDLETRLAILQKKAEREQLTIPADVLEFIAETHPHNIRELEGALNKVAAYAMLTRTTLDLTAARGILGTQVDPAHLSLESILDTVSQYYHLRSSDLKGSSRAKDISHARQVAIYAIRSMTEASFPKIGELLGGRKHTTILYAYEKIKDELERHPVLDQQIQEITRRVKNQL